MAIRPEEITDILQKELQKFERKVDVEEVGTVLQVGDGIARVYGLPDCKMGELLEFPGGVMGMALVGGAAYGVTNWVVGLSAGSSGEGEAASVSNIGIAAVASPAESR